MAKNIYCYTVWDRLQEKNILVRASMKDVRERLGISASKVNQYAEKHWVYKGKYLITKHHLDKSELNKNSENKKINLPDELIAEWDRVCLMLNPKARG